jgi:aryl-alcohol dehydrogenase-like predicted oxidoreductase
VVPAFERLRQQWKTRFLGLTAIGDTAALHRVIDARVFDSAQVVYNMLNPSAAGELQRTIQRRIMDGCSITPRRPASGLLPSACSPAGRCPDRPSAIRLLVRHQSRSVRL